MKLTEFFPKPNIIAELAGQEKAEAVHELVVRLSASGAFPRVQLNGVERALMRREELGTTGIGKGVDIPHAKHAGVNGVVGALGRSSAGVEFEALDGQPVHLIFLLVGSPDAVEPHLEALRRVTALIKDDDLCAFLRRAKNEEELAELLREADERLTG